MVNAKIFTLEQYYAIRDKEVETIINDTIEQEARLKQGDLTNKIRILRGVLPDLSSPELIAKRKQIYCDIFDNAFLDNGDVKQPTQGQKHHFLFASTHSSARETLFDKLKATDKSIPIALRKQFDKAYNKHSVVIKHDIGMAHLPEYQQAVKDEVPVPSRVVYGEVKAIISAIMSMSHEIGYNVVDLSSFYTRPQNEQKIDGFKISKGGVKDYKLISVGLVGKPQVFDEQVMESHKLAPKGYMTNIVRIGLKTLAKAESFKHLMKRSDASLLMWDNGTDKPNGMRYSVVAVAKEGKLDIYRRDLEAKFKSIGSDASIPASYGAFFDDDAGKKNSWVSKLETKQSGVSQTIQK